MLFLFVLWPSLVVQKTRVVHTGKYSKGLKDLCGCFAVTMEPDLLWNTCLFCILALSQSALFKLRGAMQVIFGA
jgi:hypothetical protein